MDRRAGFIALLGATNSGKSTLLNSILGTKVSITSRKVQTTRAQIRGIMNIGEVQLVFIDTPGIFAPRGRFDRAMVSRALSAMDSADAVLFLLDAQKGLTETFRNIVEKLKTIRSPVALAINKVDLVRKPSLLKMASDIAAAAPGLFGEIFMVSALKNDGVGDVLEWAASKMPSREWYYVGDAATDLPLGFRLAEITREKVYEYLHRELPYSIAVHTDSMDGAAIAQTIYTSEPSHKSIILGAKGAKIKAIGTAARRDMEELLNHRINLALFVKVKENWKDSPELAIAEPRPAGGISP